MCNCFCDYGDIVLVDYEIFEFLLFCFIFCCDIKFIVKVLLDCFGILVGVFGVEFVRLMEVKGIGEVVVIDFKLIVIIVYCMLKSEFKGKKVLVLWLLVVEYCYVVMVYEMCE